MSLLVLSAEDVDTLVSDFQPEDLQLIMARVFCLFSSTRGPPNHGEENPRISMPPRLTLRTQNHLALFMPARMAMTTSGGYSDISRPLNAGATAIKVVCSPNRSDPRGIPATTMVLDEATGAIKAIMNARKLTPLRNAAGSLLSTSLVGPSRPISIVAFGAGQQIEAHLDLHFRRFPSITSCMIVNRVLNDRAVSLKKGLIDRYSHPEISVIASSQAGSGEQIRDAVHTADIIVCATSSAEPLFPSSWVRTGTHIILIGSYTPSMREIDKDLIIRALAGRILVDSWEACSREAGELIDARVQPEQMVELGELIPTDENGEIKMQEYIDLLGITRKRILEEDFAGPVTIFKSVGLGVQDVAIAIAVLEKAISSGKKIGTVIPGYDA